MKTDPGNAEWQCDLSVALNRFGDVQRAQGDLAGALKSYRETLLDKEQLAQSDPSDTNCLRNCIVRIKGRRRADGAGRPCGGAEILP